MSAYWCSRVHVTDAETYAKYAALAGPAIEKYGGVFLARGGKQIILEGRSVRAKRRRSGFPVSRPPSSATIRRNIRMHASIRSGRPSVIWSRWKAWIEALPLNVLNRRGRDRRPRDRSELRI